MKNVYVESAVAVDDHRVQVRWTDGLEGLVDFSDLMDKGAYRALRDPARFRDVRVEEFGHTIFWLGDAGEELDVSPDMLRAHVDPDVAAWIGEQERRWLARRAAE